jgi:hypothetical protein
MTEEIIVAIIVGVLSLAGTLIGAYFSNRKSSALFAYRLEKLEAEVKKHNEVIERTYNLEKDMAVVKEDIRRLEDKP